MEVRVVVEPRVEGREVCGPPTAPFRGECSPGFAPGRDLEGRTAGEHILEVEDACLHLGRQPEQAVQVPGGDLQIRVPRFDLEILRETFEQMRRRSALCFEQARASGQGVGAKRRRRCLQRRLRGVQREPPVRAQLVEFVRLVATRLRAALRARFESAAASSERTSAEPPLPWFQSPWLRLARHPRTTGFDVR